MQITSASRKLRMGEEHSLIRERLRAPRAAAVAGILFCVLLMTNYLLIWISVPSSLGGPTLAIIIHSKTVSLAMNLVPFAGIAFLWFTAVVRNCLGALEDRFFATAFLGSGLLYIAMIFTSSAFAGGLIRVLSNAPELLLQTGTHALGRTQIYQTMNVYGIKTAGVFMLSTSTILLRTRVVPRWISFRSYALAVMLLLILGIILWVPLVFPAWVFLISIVILLENPSSVSPTEP